MRKSNVAPSGVYSGIYGDLPLVTPRTVAVGPGGLRFILDTGNNRVVVLNRDGTFRLAVWQHLFPVRHCRAAHASIRTAVVRWNWAMANFASRGASLWALTAQFSSPIHGTGAFRPSIAKEISCASGVYSA